jgi:hypothetical protein
MQLEEDSFSEKLTIAKLGGRTFTLTENKLSSQMTSIVANSSLAELTRAHLSPAHLPLIYLV